jgi:hypothetical protein
MNITNLPTKSAFVKRAALASLFAAVGVASIGFTETRGKADSMVASVASWPQTRVSNDQSLPDDGDLEMARIALAKGNLPLALDHISRQLDRSPGDGEALTLLAKCVRTGVANACGRGDQMEAEALVSQLSLRFQAARQARFQPDAPLTPLDDLAALDRDTQQIGVLITASADEQAAPHIDAAMGLADEAHHHWYSFRFNDRDKVREGLRELRWVHDRGPVLSRDINGRYYQALDQLKSLVADSEWEPLLAEAGYARTEVAQ